MKKALIVLLILAVAGGLFAQDITWSGAVRTGFQIDIIDGADEIGIYATDDDVPAPVKARLGMEYAPGDWGFKIGTGANLGTEDSGMFIYNAYGWIDFVDGMVTAAAGLIDDGLWGTGGELDKGFGSGGGFRLEVKPISGLSLGAMFSYPNGGVEAGKIANFFQETAFGFSYDADIFGVGAALKLYSEESSYPIGKDTDMDLIFKFSFSGVPGLGILVDGGVFHLGNYSDDGLIEVYEEVDFAVTSALKVGLLLGEKLTGADGFVWFKAKPWVEFAVNDAVSVGADFGIEMAKAGLVHKADDYTAMAADLGLSKIFADIWAKYAIGGAWIKAGYGFANFTADYGDALNHYARVTFEYSF